MTQSQTTVQPMVPEETDKVKTHAHTSKIQKMSREMRFPTMWHFDMNRLRRPLSLATPNDVRSVV